MKYTDRDYSSGHNPPIDVEPELVLADLAELDAVRAIVNAIYDQKDKIVGHLGDLVPYRDGTFHVKGEHARQIDLRVKEVAKGELWDAMCDVCPADEELVAIAHRLYPPKVPAQRLATTLEFTIPADAPWLNAVELSYA